MAPKVLVIGSGPSGIQAAHRLLERGLHVELIDFGILPTREWRGPLAGFEKFRRESPLQSEVFWGSNYSEVPLRNRKAGSGLTPPRSFVTSETEKWIPVRSEGFSPVESLARGGLGEAWGLGAFALSAAELNAIGLPAGEIAESYKRVTARIGISGAEGPSGEDGALPPLALDEAAERLWDHGAATLPWLHRNGFKLSKTPLALLSRDFKGRRASEYSDLDFYFNPGRSAYRPAFDLDALRENPRFTYSPGWLALRIEESSSGASVTALSRADRSTRKFSGDAIILCAGTLGTARIALRSGHSNLKLICSPYYQIIGLQLPFIGRVLRDARHSLGQLVLEHRDPIQAERVSLLSLLSYRSLLLTRLMREAPIPLRQARQIFHLLQSGLTVGGLFLPQALSDAHLSLRLESDSESPTFDRLLISSSTLNPSTLMRERRTVALLRKGMRKLGALPLRTVRMEAGASIHYGGTLPFGAGTDAATGRLDGYSKVFVGDGSPFRLVPGKGITLTLMAYADWAADRVADFLQPK